MSYNYSGNAIYGGELTIGGVDFSHAATNFSYYPNVGDHLAYYFYLFILNLA